MVERNIRTAAVASSAATGAFAGSPCLTIFRKASVRRLAVSVKVVVAVMGFHRRG
jgi:hypothetical protein